MLIPPTVLFVILSISPETVQDWMYVIILGLLIVIGFLIAPFFKKEIPDAQQIKTIDILFAKLDNLTNHQIIIKEDLSSAIINVKDDITKISIKVAKTETQVNNILTTLPDLKDEIKNIKGLLP